MENKMKNEGGGFWVKISTFIVDKRNLFFLLFALAVIGCLVTASWVKVENNIAQYLPDESETRQGLTLMEEEYITYGTAKIMIQNITYERGEELAELMEARDDVSMVQFDSTEDHYNDFSGLFTVTFCYEETDEKCLEALDDLKVMLSDLDQDFYVSTTLGDQSAELIAQQIQVVTVFVAIIVLLVLLLTSNSYAEIVVLIATFLVSAALASGTNFILGTISFVSNSVTIVLQLALSVDYAVILLNKYKVERENLDARTADIIALSKAIPEISASSLTTIGGLIAMSFMQFGIGPDMAIVLIKAILLSLLTVFTLMPGLIMLFATLMEKTQHKSFVPKIPFVGKFAYATRFVIPVVFLFVVIGAYYYSSKCPYVYGYSLVETAKKSDQDLIDDLIEETFHSSNLVALNLPGGDYAKEARLLAELESMPEVQSAMGLANTEAMNGVMLTDKLNARQFSELVGIDNTVAELLYAAYAVNDENYGKLIGISEYTVPFIDLFIFLHSEIENELISLDDDQADMINDAYDKIMIARNQLQGENYDRLLLYLDLPEEGDETFAFIDELHTIGKTYYGEEANILVTGNSTSQYDLKTTFSRDNMVVNIVSMLAVLVVLLFTFKSAGMPVLLIIVIEGCIWLNFSFPYLTHTNLFFMGYLIVSSIQMGANIDYAIVVSSRYQEVKKVMPPKEAIIDTMNYAFPTIITSGTMLAMAGFLIGNLTSEPCISGIGTCIGRGTVISILIVMFVLPQILLLGDKLIEKTSFVLDVSLPITTEKSQGLVRLDGFVSGHIDGEVIGFFRGTVIGEVDVRTQSGGAVKEFEPTAEDVKKLEGGNDDEA